MSELGIDVVQFYFTAGCLEIAEGAIMIKTDLDFP